MADNILSHVVKIAEYCNQIKKCSDCDLHRGGSCVLYQETVPSMWLNQETV